MVMLRRKPSLPVLQKEQAMAQPTCVDTHCVMRTERSLGRLGASLGMSTVSTSSPSASSSRNLVVPSELTRTSAMEGQRISATSASLALSFWERSVMASKPDTFFTHIHCHICVARNFLNPSSSMTKRSRAGYGRSQRFTLLASDMNNPRPQGGQFSMGFASAAGRQFPFRARKLRGTRGMALRQRRKINRRRRRNIVPESLPARPSRGMPRFPDAEPALLPCS